MENGMETGIKSWLTGLYELVSIQGYQGGIADGNGGVFGSLI